MLGRILLRVCATWASTRRANYGGFLLLTLQLGEDDEDKENQSRSTAGSAAVKAVCIICSDAGQATSEGTSSPPGKFLRGTSAANIEEDAFGFSMGCYSALRPFLGGLPNANARYSYSSDLAPRDRTHLEGALGSTR